MAEFEKYAPPEFPEISWECAGWEVNETLRKLACAFDMAMMQHPENPLSPARITTLHFRGRANATLNTLASLLDPLGPDLLDVDSGSAEGVHCAGGRARTRVHQA